MSDIPLQVTEVAGKEMVEAPLEYGDNTVMYEKTSSDSYSSVYWRGDMGLEDFVGFVDDEFGDNISAEAVIMGETGWRIESTLGDIRNRTNFYDRTKFLAVGDDSYEVTWEADGQGGADNELCFLLKQRDSARNSLLEDFLNKTIDSADKAYNDVKQLHETDYEDLREDSTSA